MLDVWTEEDPSTKKKIPVVIDILEFLAQLVRDKYET